MKEKRSITTTNGNPPDVLTITPSMYPPLTHPLDLKLWREDDFWIAENVIIGLRSAGETLDALKEDVLVLLDFMVDRYLVQGKTQNVTEKLRQNIEELRKTVDPTKRPDEDHWEDVE